MRARPDAGRADPTTWHTGVNLWDVTWDKINRFNPSLQHTLFADVDTAGRNGSRGSRRERGNERTSERANERARERGNEGTRERGDEGTRERGDEGTRERGNVGTRERGNERTRERGDEGTRELGNVR